MILYMKSLEVCAFLLTGMTVLVIVFHWHTSSDDFFNNVLFSFVFLAFIFLSPFFSSLRRYSLLLASDVLSSCSWIISLYCKEDYLSNPQSCCNLSLLCISFPCLILSLIHMELVMVCTASRTQIDQLFVVFLLR